MSSLVAQEIKIGLSLGWDFSGGFLGFFRVCAIMCPCVWTRCRSNDDDDVV